MKDFVTLIPARGGSKGIRRKNLQDIGGLPMLAYAILASSNAASIQETIVSSEDDEILQVAETFGAKPLRRPVALAQDHSSTESVIAHFLTTVKTRNVVVIQPTSPMLSNADLEKAICKYKKGEYDSMFSAARVNDMLMWDSGSMYPLNYDPKRRGRRQVRKRYLLWENGAFFIFKKRTFIDNNCRFGSKIGYADMPFWRSFQVDNPSDLEKIRVLMTLKS